MGRSGMVRRVRGVPIYVQKLPVGQVYPVSVKDVESHLQRMPANEVRSLKKVEFVPPRDKQEEDAWARYLRSKRSMLVFSQKVDKSGKVGGEDPKSVERHMKEYVIPHELGHHSSLTTRGITDKKLSMAEARADAVAVGMDPEDSQVKKLFAGQYKSLDREERSHRHHAKKDMHAKLHHEFVGDDAQSKAWWKAKKDEPVQDYLKRNLSSIENGDRLKKFSTGVRQMIAHPWKDLDGEWQEYTALVDNKPYGPRGHSEKLSKDKVLRAQQRGAALFGRVASQANVEPLIDGDQNRTFREIMMDIEFGRRM